MLDSQTCIAFAAGLKDLIDCGDNGTLEQRSVLQAIAFGLLKIPLDEFQIIKPVNQSGLAKIVTSYSSRRRYIQLAVMLDLCRHPRSSQQVAKLEQSVQGLKLKSDVLTICRNLIDHSALEIASDFVRRYQTYFLALQEKHGPESLNHEGGRHYDEQFFKILDSLSSMNEGTLGNEFVRFYQRNGMNLPSRSSINPGYYVCHDMNHVIAGYEPTGIGEICLGALKLGMDDSEANWMASLTNFLIHEAGVIKPGHHAQYEPLGVDGDPFDGLDGKRGVMTLKGAPEMLANAFDRGSNCSKDFSTLDHLEFATMPLTQLRKEFNVTTPLMGVADSSLCW
tara:strand:+ start:229 stop:1239 length:1011 start_codon:yes stop_codon:yes gene_type:complete